MPFAGRIGTHVDISFFVKAFVVNTFLWLWVLLALCILWAAKTHRRARWLGGILLLGLWLLATRPAAEALLRPLENRYTAPSLSALKERGVHQVVVLMGGSFPPRGELLSSAVGASTLSRFAGGVELCAKLGPACRLVFSGSASLRHPEWSDALTLQKLALMLAPGRQALAEARSARTTEHPRNLRPLVGNEPFILVTSAAHMPRAVRTFDRAGLDPIPYPVDFQVFGDYGWEDWLPNTDSLVTVEIALKEYLGLAYYATRGSPSVP